MSGAVCCATLLGLLPLIASCYGAISNNAAALPGVGTDDICRFHHGSNAADVYGNDMYVRCNDGTILTR